MARFRYRMQNLLNIKEKLEAQAKNEYAQANMELAEEQEKLRQMHHHKLLLEEESRELRRKETLSIRDIEDNKLYIELMEDRMRAQELVIQAAQRKVEQKRKVMTELMQERKTHEILKKRAFEQFLMEEKAEESKQIDQLTSYTYGRNS